ncbi:MULTISPECIES: tol-pal system YbgF family protein [unclassified Dyadobacter]|uniref:tetratricopeptide repeat protein n=1 Tax=unclassified Dyadobacter TaxID=2625061 RepID=UPI0011F38327|nr:MULTISPECIES: hypothetical protein [unclassified Dyadobacter]
MSVSTTNRLAWISLVPQLGFTALLIGLYYILGITHSFFFGIMTYLAGSSLIQFFTIKHLRQALRDIKAGDFDAAILGFQSSYDILSKYPLIDKYRYLILLSSSKISYREMALNNIAFCYSQIGEEEKAIVLYNRMLAEYPGSTLAKTALDSINAIRKDS